MAPERLSMQRTPPERASDVKWFVVASMFVVLEWGVLFWPDLRSSFSFLRQTPKGVSCPDWSNAETAFLNMKAWVVVSLSQAIIWGVVTYVSIRWLIALWRTGKASGRWGRVGIVALKSLTFGLLLWFFLTPAPKWDLGCFSRHINLRGSAVLAYVAVGSAAIVMWVLESRVVSLVVTPKPEVSQFLELRGKLQTLLSLSSVVLAFGIIGLVARQAFVGLSPKKFFPQPIILEGFEYSVLLGLAYAPVHAAFNAVGAKIRDELMSSAQKDDVKALEDRSRLSNKLGDLMQIRFYDWKSFGPGFSILAPFLLGLLATLAKP